MNPKLIEVIEDEPDEDYHKRGELSSHDLKMFLDDEFLFYRTKVIGDLELEDKRTPELIFGSRLHQILEHKGDVDRFIAVEPKGFEEHSFKQEYLDNLSDVVEVPDDKLMNGARRGKAYQDWKKELPENAIIADKEFNRALYEKYKSFVGDSKGKELIKSHKPNRYAEILKTIQRNSITQQMLESENAMREVTIIWEHPTGIKCRSRLDYVSSFIADWKTILNAKKAESAIVQYKYDLSFAFYQMAAYAWLGKWMPMYWIFLQKVPGYGMRIMSAEKWLDYGHKTVKEAMERLAITDWASLYNRPVEVTNPPAWRDKVIVFEDQE